MKLIKMTLPSGRVVRFGDTSTKQYDPEFKAASDAGVKSILEKGNSAIQAAKRRGVPLSTIIPVN